MHGILEDEEWRVIFGYPNYEVSNFGRVRNARNQQILRPFVKFGYEYVELYHYTKSQQYRVNRLVARAFLPLRTDANQVNHDDGDKRYNVVDNLEWSTSSENIQHAYQTGLKRPSNKRAVRIIETGDEFDSLTECAKSIGTSAANIHACLSGRVKSHRGFTFEEL